MEKVWKIARDILPPTTAPRPRSANALTFHTADRRPNQQPTHGDGLEEEATKELKGGPLQDHLEAERNASERTDLLLNKYTMGNWQNSRYFSYDTMGQVLISVSGGDFDSYI